MNAGQTSAGKTSAGKTIPALVPQSELNAVIREICAVVQRHHRAVAANALHLRELRLVVMPAPETQHCIHLYEDSQLCDRQTDGPDYCAMHARQHEQDGAR